MFGEGVFVECIQYIAYIAGDEYPACVDVHRSTYDLYGTLLYESTV
jgi:hypothetical protein